MSDNNALYDATHQRLVTLERSLEGLQRQFVALRDIIENDHRHELDDHGERITRTESKVQAHANLLLLMAEKLESMTRALEAASTALTTNAPILSANSEIMRRNTSILERMDTQLTALPSFLKTLTGRAEGLGIADALVKAGF